MSKRKKTRQRKKRKRSLSDVRIPLKKILLTTSLYGLVTAGAFYGTGVFLLTSPFFAVKEIVVNKEEALHFSNTEKKLKDLYIGRNIFTVDIKETASMINKLLPQLKRVEVGRSLPQRLEIDIVVRRPAAVIDAGKRKIMMDKEGVVLGGDPSREKLVSIKGIGFFLRVPRPGEKVKNASASKALLLLEVLRRKNLIKLYDVKHIDVSDPDNILLNVADVTVKMGSGDFSRKIEKFSKILADPNISLRDIDYIDLRFENAIISPK